MEATTFLKIPIRSMDSDTFASTYPLPSNSPGDLYCGWCLHDIRLVCRTKTGVICADCGQNLDFAPQSFID